MISSQFPHAVSRCAAPILASASRSTLNYRPIVFAPSMMSIPKVAPRLEGCNSGDIGSDNPNCRPQVFDVMLGGSAVDVLHQDSIADGLRARSTCLLLIPLSKPSNEFPR